MYPPGLWRNLNRMNIVVFFCRWLATTIHNSVTLLSSFLLCTIFPSPGAAKTSVALMAEVVGNFPCPFTPFSAFLSDNDTERKMEGSNLRTQKLLQGYSSFALPVSPNADSHMKCSWGFFNISKIGHAPHMVGCSVLGMIFLDGTPTKGLKGQLLSLCLLSYQGSHVPAKSEQCRLFRCCCLTAPTILPVSMESELQTQWVQWLANLHASLQRGEVVGDHSSTLQNVRATLSWFSDLFWWLREILSSSSKKIVFILKTIVSKQHFLFSSLPLL